MGLYKADKSFFLISPPVISAESLLIAVAGRVEKHVTDTHVNCRQNTRPTERIGSRAQTNRQTDR